MPDEARKFVDAELALIRATSDAELSPIFTYDAQPDDMKYREDYSQYIPRGHYTLSPELEMYFRAMIWYGRMNYRLKDPMEVQRSLLITKALRETTTINGKSALKLGRTSMIRLSLSWVKLMISVCMNMELFQMLFLVKILNCLLLQMKLCLPPSLKQRVSFSARSTQCGSDLAGSGRCLQGFRFMGQRSLSTNTFLVR